jgi:hypothetical protein
MALGWQQDCLVWFEILDLSFTSLISPRTSFNVAEQRFTIDLDAEKGRRPRDIPDTTYVVIRPVKTIRMAVIGAYLSKQMAFDNSVLEAISKSAHCS